MVRLLRGGAEAGVQLQISFNPTMVRLLHQSEQRNFVS